MSSIPDYLEQVEHLLIRQANSHEKLKIAIQSVYPKVNNQNEIKNYCFTKIRDTYSHILKNLEEKVALTPLALLDEKSIPEPDLNWQTSSIAGNEKFYISQCKANLRQSLIIPINNWISVLNETQQLLLSQQKDNGKASEKFFSQLSSQRDELACQIEFVPEKPSLRK